MTVTTMTPTGEVAEKPLKRSGLARIRWNIVIPLILYAIFTLVPFYWILLFSFRSPGSSSLIPVPFTFEHYSNVWNGIGFGVFFKNSIIVAGFTLIFVTLLSILGGYALARYNFKGRSLFMLALLVTQFIPGAMMLIPLFEIFRGLGIINNLTSLIIADTAFQLPLSLILMSGFIRNIPMELEEATWVDGCSRWKGFRIVILPMLQPALVAVGSFAFVNAWNNFLFALMFVNDQSKFTTSVGLSYMLGEFSVDFGALAAGGVIAAVPVVIIFAFVQKYLVQGLSAGAIKG